MTRGEGRRCGPLPHPLSSPFATTLNLHSTIANPQPSDFAIPNSAFTIPSDRPITRFPPITPQVISVD